MRRDENEIRVLIDEAIAGNNRSLEELLDSVQDIVFNLSLRMLGTVQDAEDAAQEILIRIMTHLSSFRRESSFRTWVYRLAVNYLKNYKRSMFAGQPLDFEYYGNDIRYADMGSIDDLVDDISRETLAEELKMCCTNVMLQCLDPESRCIFIFGTMFKRRNLRSDSGELPQKAFKNTEKGSGFSGCSLWSNGKRYLFLQQAGQLCHYSEADQPGKIRLS